ncbi:unnamed protein product [Plutella xylostella]|uniref:(diamondback moth) hypothetical protein n=1 Tax=Plutella xylostella TaxID=51655 RepID=A0A8S4GEH1_PLUXY|nr:unnamed protein product [Plutella xylostella]
MGFDVAPYDKARLVKSHCLEPPDSRSSTVSISLPDSARLATALEAFRHNPADGSFAPPAARPSA